LNTKNKTILQLLQARQKSGTAMAGPAVPPTTALPNVINRCASLLCICQS